MNISLNNLIEQLKRDNQSLEHNIKDLNKKYEDYMRKTEIRQAELETRVKKSETETISSTRVNPAFVVSVLNLLSELVIENFNLDFLYCLHELGVELQINRFSPLN